MISKNGASMCYIYYKHFHYLFKMFDWQVTTSLSTGAKIWNKSSLKCQKVTRTDPTTKNIWSIVRLRGFFYCGEWCRCSCKTHDTTQCSMQWTVWYVLVYQQLLVLWWQYDHQLMNRRKCVESITTALATQTLSKIVTEILNALTILNHALNHFQILLTSHATLNENESEDSAAMKKNYF